MNEAQRARIDRLAAEHSLPPEEYGALLAEADAGSAERLAAHARRVREAYYGRAVFLRGLIEISNHCKNNCLYCGIRRGNRALCRYRLTGEEILACCREGHALGFRTFVLQGGEDPWFTDARLAPLVAAIKKEFPDCAVTLSQGERSLESYRALRQAGADRYLLRHETADEAHYGLLHPPELSWRHRMDCLRRLRECGYQVGCGFMVGSPHQTLEHLVKELCFIESFKPDMCGVGPFIPHSDTPFRGHPAGSADITCILLSCIRLIHPPVLLPATTALGTLREDGRERGILAGANVVMPNLSPARVRKQYMLYDNKRSDGAESAQARAELERRLLAIGHTVADGRGDIIRKDR